MAFNQAAPLIPWDSPRDPAENIFMLNGALVSSTYQIPEIHLWYPGTNEEACKAVIVGLMDTRAADKLRIRFDYDESNWVVEQLYCPEDINEDLCWRVTAVIPTFPFEKQRTRW